MASGHLRGNSTFSETQLEEAELIINLTSHVRPQIESPTVTQKNTSVANTQTVQVSPSKTSTVVRPDNEGLLSSISQQQHLRIEIEPADTHTPGLVPGNTQDASVAGASDPAVELEDNTVSIVGNVAATTYTGLISDQSGAVVYGSETDTHQWLVTEGEDHMIVDAEETVVESETVIETAQVEEETVVETTQAETTQAEEETPSRPKLNRMIVIKVVDDNNGNAGDSADASAKSKDVRQHGNIQIFETTSCKSKQTGGTDITIERKKVHECVVCKAKFFSIVALFRHRVEHNESVPTKYTCTRCDMTFTDLEEVEKHEFNHIDNRVFECTFCQSTFTTLHNFKCHLRIHSTPGPVVCNMCYQVFDKRSKYIAHMDDHAWGPSNQRLCHQCPVCNKYFADNQKLKRHSLRHCPEKQFKCELCPKEFMERNKLTRHMLTHTGRREFNCPHCDKTFGLKHNLNTHMKIHSNIRPFVCKVCDRSFVQRIVLQRHMRIHQDYITDVLDKGIPSYCVKEINDI